MRRINVVGVVLLVVFALSAVMASGASAAGPLFLLTKRDCVEVFPGEGKFGSRLACENGKPVSELGTWALQSKLSNVKLLAGEMADAKVTSLGTFKLHLPFNVIITCTNFSAPTLLGTQNVMRIAQV